MAKKSSSRALLAVFFCLLVYVSLDHFFKFIQERNEVYQRARKIFSQEVTSTLQGLSLKMNQLVSSLEKEGAGGLLDQNFSRRFFHSHLEVSELEEVQVYTGECQLIWTYSLLKRRENECFHGESGIFAVTNYKDTPVVSLTKPFHYEGKSYFIQGGVHIGNSWLKERPLLSKIFENEGLFLSSDPGNGDAFSAPFFTLFPKGSVFNINLKIDRFEYPVLKYFIERRHRGLVAGEVIFVLCFLLLILLLIDSRKQRTKREGFFYHFESWCREALLLPEKELYSLCLKVLREEKKSSQSKFYKWSAELISKILQRNFKLENKLKEFERKLDIHERENVTLNVKSHKLSHYESLSQQIHELYPKLAKEMKHMTTKSQSIKLTLTGEVLKKLSLMNFQFKDWKNQGEKVGLRKHMRSLHETKGSHGLISMLEEQIRFFNSATESLLKEVNDCLNSAREIEGEGKTLELVLGYWKDFVSVKSEEESLLSLIKRALELHKVFNPEATLDHEKVSSKLKLPLKADAIRLVAAFYHLFQYGSYGKGEEALKFTLSSALEGEKAFLFISSNRPFRRDLKDSSFVIAEVLLKSMEMSQKQLSVDASTFVSLEWQRKELSETSAVSKESARELGLSARAT